MDSSSSIRISGTSLLLSCLIIHSVISLLLLNTLSCRLSLVYIQIELGRIYGVVFGYVSRIDSPILQLFGCWTVAFWIWDSLILTSIWDSFIEFVFCAVEVLVCIFEIFL